MENKEYDKTTANLYKLYDTTIQKYINKILIECGYFIKEKKKKPILIIDPFNNNFHFFKFLLNICNIISSIYNYDIYIRISPISFLFFNLKNKIKVKRLKKKYNEEEGINIVNICIEFIIKKEDKEEEKEEEKEVKGRRKKEEEKKKERKKKKKKRKEEVLINQEEYNLLYNICEEYYK